MGGKSKAIQTLLNFGGAADEAGDAVRSLLADDSMFAAFRRPEVMRHLPPDIQVRVMRNDPSVISDIMALGRGGKANIDDVAARATPAVEIPYANQGVGRREAPLDPSSEWTNMSSSAHLGYSGPGIMKFPPPAVVVHGERGLSVIPHRPKAEIDDDVIDGGNSYEDVFDPVIIPDTSPGRYDNKGAGRWERPMEAGPDWASPPTTKELSILPVKSGPGVPVMPPRGLIVRPQDPHRIMDWLPTAAALSAAGGATAWALSKDNNTLSPSARSAPNVYPSVRSAPNSRDPVSILTNMGLTRERAKQVAQFPERMTSRELRQVRQLPEATQKVILKE